jgi:hypothetical protein
VEGLIMENNGIFYGHLEYVTTIWYILWPFGNFVVKWYIFHSFWYMYCTKKDLATLVKSLRYASEAPKYAWTERACHKWAPKGLRYQKWKKSFSHPLIFDELLRFVYIYCDIWRAFAFCIHILWYDTYAPYHY